MLYKYVLYIYIHICHIYIYIYSIYIQYIYIYSVYIYVDIPTISPSLISVRRVAMCIQDIGGRHGPTGATEALVRHLLTHRASASGNFRPQSDHWKMGKSWEIPYKYGKIWEMLKKILGQSWENMANPRTKWRFFIAGKIVELNGDFPLQG